MKITLKELQEKRESYERLLGASDVPAGTMFRIRAFVKAVMAALKQLDDERTELIKKHGEKIAGDRYKLKKDKIDTFLADFDEVLKEEVELPEVKIGLNELEGAKGLKPVDFGALEDIIVEEKD
jgi:3-deoxy-D-arabino-heptulosonate 7-phosphate (DAHP) synthase class II